MASGSPSRSRQTPGATLLQDRRPDGLVAASAGDDSAWAASAEPAMRVADRRTNSRRVLFKRLSFPGYAAKSRPLYEEDNRSADENGMAEQRELKRSCS